MRNINFKILAISLIFILIVAIGKCTFAKYVFNPSKTLIIETNLDRTPPKLDLSYSTTTLTNGNVLVTITSNEKIKNVEGWNLSSDEKSLTKLFIENGSEKVDVYDVAGNKTSTNVSITNIDKILPLVECISINNSNTNYPLFANSEKVINLKIKVSDNKEIKNINLNNINIYVGSSPSNLNKEWTLLSSNSKEKVYNLKLTNIQGNGILTLSFENGFVTDTSNNNNNKYNLDTQITIDNIKPTIKYSQTTASQGKINAILTGNEKLQNLNGWNISSDSKKLSKEFASNVSYELTVSDLAGNRTITIVSVTNATHIKLTYASHNSNIGWSYGYGNYDIAGKQSVLTNPIYKTEALSFRIDGNVSTDFILGRSYIYSHWGEGSKARCSDSGMIYNYGYNPSSSSWKSMNSSDLVTIAGKKFFQFGGAGINSSDRTDINGNNPIGIENDAKFQYGICGITLALKNYTDYSIVYQVYVSSIGWLQAKSNGQEAMYSKTKPMSAFRVAIIPNSEKGNLINTWNKDINKKIK